MQRYNGTASDFNLARSYKYRREGNVRQLNSSYFKFMIGFNFRIVWYAHIHYFIVQKFSLDYFLYTCQFMKINSMRKKPALRYNTDTSNGRGQQLQCI